MSLDDAANHFEREALGCRINGQHFAALHVGVVFPQLDVLSRLERAAVEKSDGSREQHHVALLDGSIEEWLVGPRGLDDSALVLVHPLEDSSCFTGGDDVLG